MYATRPAFVQARTSLQFTSLNHFLDVTSEEKFLNELKFYHVVTIEARSNFCMLTRTARFTNASFIPIHRVFSIALRAAFGQAPKVILVGEMRDKETIEVALEAAQNRPPCLVDTSDH